MSLVVEIIHGIPTQFGSDLLLIPHKMLEKNQQVTFALPERLAFCLCYTVGSGGRNASVSQLRLQCISCRVNWSSPDRDTSRDHSTTMWTEFCHFLTPPLRGQFYTLSVDKNKHFLTPSPPQPVHVIIECPLRMRSAIKIQFQCRSVIKCLDTIYFGSQLDGPKWQSAVITTPLV